MAGRRALTVAAVVAGALGGAGAAASADDGPGRGSLGPKTQADYAPTFSPVTSLTCPQATPGGRLAKPFVLPSDYDQQVVAEEGDPGTTPGQQDNWDMITQNMTGKDKGRFVYRTHETNTGASVSVTDLKTNKTTVLAQRADWERFDGITWTKWGTLLAAEETNTATLADPTVPQAKAGLVYEYFIDKDDPTKLDPAREPIHPGPASSGGDGTTDTTADGIRARPAVGSKSHEGMRFDKRGNFYGIAEVSNGAIFRFVPDHPGDLGRGDLYALKTANGRTGSGSWVKLDRQAVQVNANAEAVAKGANQYNRPEDVETGVSSGRDRNNGGNTLYVAITAPPSNNEVLAVDLSDRDAPFAYQYVGQQEAKNVTQAEFNWPDNVALDRQGNLAITEDQPDGYTTTDDIWIAAPPEDPSSHQPAKLVKRFATLKDCAAEPTGLWFAVAGTERFATLPAYSGLVNGQSLFVNRQHSGMSTPNDQFVSIAPKGATGEDEDDRGEAREPEHGDDHGKDVAKAHEDDHAKDDAEDHHGEQGEQGERGHARR